FPRGLAFDSIGNLCAAQTVQPDDHSIGRVLRFSLRNKASTAGSAAYFFFEGLAVDIAGNAYVMATDDRSPTEAGTIFKFTSDGERIVFGSVPGTTPGNEPQPNWGLAFDNAGNLYAADGGAQTIYKFAPNGTRTVFVAEANAIPDGDILKFPPGGGSYTVFASGFGRPEFLTFGPPR